MGLTLTDLSYAEVVTSKLNCKGFPHSRLKCRLLFIKLTYLGSVFFFNYRIVIQKNYRPYESRHYDKTFRATILESIPAYKPRFNKAWKPVFCDPEKHQYYSEIRTIFPDSEIIGYVSPISSWKLFNDFYMKNIINCTLKNLREISDNYDRVYDFSMPSEITQDPSHTYDGSHFYLPINKKIAEILLAKPKQRDRPFGYGLVGRSLEEYQQEFHKQMKAFILSENREDLWEEHLKRVPYEKTKPEP